MSLKSPVLEHDAEAIALNHFEDGRVAENDVDPDDMDNDTASLLGSRSRSRGLERPSPSKWVQVKGLLTEAAPALLLTTISLTFTGNLLEHVSRWRAMKKLDQLIVLIPILLNLNGNIEMTLSARLGTAANVGELDDSAIRNAMIFGNLALVQVQAISVSFIATWVSLLLGLVLPRRSTSGAIASFTNTAITVFDQRKQPRALLSRRPIPRPSGDPNKEAGIHTIAMVAASAMSAASLSGLFLGSFMCLLTVLCRRFGFDPDNIAPPIASCLGDLVTLSLLGLVSSALIPFLNTPVPFVILALVTSIAIISLYFSRRSPHVTGLLSQGWSPLFGAMVISSVTGVVLDLFVRKYQEYAFLAVVISGLPGAVGCLYVSRLSTALHTAALKCLPCFSDFTLDGQNTLHSSISPPGRMKSMPIEHSPRLATITLFTVVLPIEIAFIWTLRALGLLHAPIIFLFFSILCFSCAVIISLLTARLLTNFLWRRGLDPDIYALPIHSALMDLVGQTLLVLCFEVVSLLTDSMTRSSS